MRRLLRFAFPPGATVHEEQGDGKASESLPASVAYTIPPPHTQEREHKYKRPLHECLLAMNAVGFYTRIARSRLSFLFFHMRQSGFRYSAGCARPRERFPICTRKGVAHHGQHKRKSHQTLHSRFSDPDFLVQLRFLPADHSQRLAWHARRVICPLPDVVTGRGRTDYALNFPRQFARARIRLGQNEVSGRELCDSAGLCCRRLRSIVGSGLRELSCADDCTANAEVRAAQFRGELLSAARDHWHGAILHFGAR